MSIDQVESFLKSNASTFEDDLFDLLRIPSISADSAYKGEVLKAANWLAKMFRGFGLSPEVIPTEGHPILYAETPPVAGAPVVLVYGHYDVQPAKKSDGWDEEPFVPVRKNGNVIARGSTDDKGQMLTHVQSARAWLKSIGKLPVQLKFLIEGEEEVSSHSLYGYLADNAKKLACDVVVVSDTAQFAVGQPAITYGLRGIAYFEVKFFGPKIDQHSGVFGGAVTNPINALTQLLSKMIDSRGRIQIPGFYDAVVPLTEAERKQFAQLGFDEEAFKKGLGVDGLTGEEGFTTLERRWARPTFDINGIYGGYQGEGSKTVLPASAGAKFSFRLVPNQSPAEIQQLVKTFVEKNIPPGIRFELINHGAGSGALTPLESPYMKAAAKAVTAGFGKAPVFIREGGSIPIVAAFQQTLKADTLLLGWGQNDDNAHGPNEKFLLADYHHGIRASAHLWHELATAKK
jgi:acetylornithine deacetylase/succinyl-diaminopimelate desuccinylase-like protein